MSTQQERRANYERRKALIVGLSLIIVGLVGFFAWPMPDQAALERQCTSSGITYTSETFFMKTADGRGVCFINTGAEWQDLKVYSAKHAQ